MAEESYCGPGCGCNTTSLYSEKGCPVCGKKLRVTGSLQKFEVNLTCSACGYRSARLSADELAALID